ncbi:MAG: ion channel [Chloroflexota bacterium]|nr:two pore domain potassium channel family protein [Anaerolineales bacterium]MCA9976306.1 two pore domain potassium channel family protein [Anaerolineales bacterium]MCB8966924.1 two pore domain potassium channel family protein [Ardenticatenaceae bacterium]
MLTPAQQQALDTLFAQAADETAVPPASDMLQTWLGISSTQLQDAWRSLLAKKDQWEGAFLDWAERNPLDAVFSFLGASAVAFYRAEKDVNPRINSYVDAFYYIATCASVGYADIFAVTQSGKAIAALVMVVGPALADRSINRPAP